MTNESIQNLKNSNAELEATINELSKKEWPLKGVMRKMQEETLELALAITQNFNKDINNWPDIIREMVDVQLLTNQILFNLKDNKEFMTDYHEAYREKLLKVQSKFDKAMSDGLNPVTQLNTN
jgi:hypothetical protein